MKKSFVVFVLCLLSQISWASPVLEEIDLDDSTLPRLRIFVDAISLLTQGSPAFYSKRLRVLTPPQLACIARQMSLFNQAAKNPVNQAALMGFGSRESLEISFRVYDQNVPDKQQSKGLYINGKILGLHFGYNAVGDCVFMSASDLAKEFQEIKVNSDQIGLRFGGKQKASQMMEKIIEDQNEALKSLSNLNIGVK